VEESSILTVSPSIKLSAIKYSKRKENNLTLNNKEFSMHNIKVSSKMLLRNKKEAMQYKKRTRRVEKMIKK